MSTPYFLYAENDLEDVDVMQQLWKEQASTHEMVCVSDGFELLQYLQNVEQGAAYPSLIILDVNMPRLDGIETFELLKRDDIYRLIPLVMLTSDTQNSQLNACRKMGIDIMTKPLNGGDWKKTMNYLTSYIDQ